MIRCAAVGLCVVAVIAAPAAMADPEDLEPYCTSGQVPINGECKPVPESSAPGSLPGLNPEVPLGLNPGTVPAV